MQSIVLASCRVKSIIPVTAKLTEVVRGCSGERRHLYAISIHSVAPFDIRMSEGAVAPTPPSNAARRNSSTATAGFAMREHT